MPLALVFDQANDALRWCEPIQVYGTAGLDSAALAPRDERSLLSTLHGDATYAAMRLVYEQVNGPDRAFMRRVAKPLMGDIAFMAETSAYQALGTLPILAGRGQYEANAGLLSQAHWRADRGGGKAATPAWFAQRIREALRLRGTRDGFEAEMGERAADQEHEFNVIVRECFLIKEVRKPRHTPGRMHNWARECVEDVVRALGAHAATRRYVFDHRWEPDGRGGWRYNMISDSNDLSFVIPGDCEDSNSTIYFLALQLLRGVAGDNDADTALLRNARTCVFMAGVPCCTVGSSEPPHYGEIKKGYRGAHLFGFFIPHRVFAKAVWGAGSVDDAMADLAETAGVTDRYAFDTAIPQARPRLAAAG